MKRILSFDASTTTIGYCVIDYSNTDAKLIKLDFYKPSKKGHILERLSLVRKFIQDKITEFKPNITAIEEIVLFMGGKSTAKTITTLAVLNRTVGLSIYDVTGKLPYMYNAMKIRHSIKQEKLPAKEDIPELVSKILNFEFPYLYKKDSTSLKDENYDMADAVAVALCHIFNDREGIADQSQVKKKKKRKKKK